MRSILKPTNIFPFVLTPFQKAVQVNLTVSCCLIHYARRPKNDVLNQRHNRVIDFSISTKFRNIVSPWPENLMLRVRHWKKIILIVKQVQKKTTIRRPPSVDWSGKEKIHIFFVVNSSGFPWCSNSPRRRLQRRSLPPRPPRPHRVCNNIFFKKK